jgi:hypothetical protein
MEPRNANGNASRFDDASRRHRAGGDECREEQCKA